MLVICKACQHKRRWTIGELLERYGGRMLDRMAKGHAPKPPPDLLPVPTWDDVIKHGNIRRPANQRI